MLGVGGFERAVVSEIFISCFWKRRLTRVHDQLTYVCNGRSLGCPPRVEATFGDGSGELDAYSQQDRKAEHPPRSCKMAALTPCFISRQLTRV